jgi:hypothetical protein
MVQEKTGIPVKYMLDFQVKCVKQIVRDGGDVKGNLKKFIDDVNDELIMRIIPFMREHPKPRESLSKRDKFIYDAFIEGRKRPRAKEFDTTGRQGYGSGSRHPAERQTPRFDADARFQKYVQQRGYDRFCK